jgi:hypothetical protein
MENFFSLINWFLVHCIFLENFFLSGQMVHFLFPVFILSHWFAHLIWITWLTFCSWVYCHIMVHFFSLYLCVTLVHCISMGFFRCMVHSSSMGGGLMFFGSLVIIRFTWLNWFTMCFWVYCNQVVHYIQMALLDLDGSLFDIGFLTDCGLLILYNGRKY